MESRVLKGVFVPDQGFQFDTLLAGARRAKEAAEREFQSTIGKARSELAKAIWRDRARSRARTRRILKEAENALRIKNLFESQRLYQEVVKAASRDCLEIALKLSRELVGEICTRDAERLAAMIQEALQHLSGAEVLQVEVAKHREQDLKTALTRWGVNLCVAPSEQIPAGAARLRTKSGTIEISWEDDFEELASSVRGALEARQVPVEKGASL